MAAPPQQFEGDVQCPPSSTLLPAPTGVHGKAFDPASYRSYGPRSKLSGWSDLR
jgi:hypothetical protein